MRVVKKINNNVAFCIDHDGRELIAFGRGIGFPALPYEITDLSCIERTYYGVDTSYVRLLDEIPPKIFELSANIVDQAKMTIHNEINANIVFTLADHINFAIERYRKSMNLKMPFSHDIQHLYEEEMRVGEYAVRLINKEFHIFLSKEEAISIALHLINAENIRKDCGNQQDEDIIIFDITKLIEQTFQIQIDRDGFNYARFITHLQYLLKRKGTKKEMTSDNQKLYEVMKQDFSSTYACVEQIRAYLISNLSWNPGEEELMYLMLHINRLCTREDCNR